MRLLRRLVAIREDANIPLYDTTNIIVRSVMFIYLNNKKNEINLHAKYKRVGGILLHLNKGTRQLIASTKYKHGYDDTCSLMRV